MVASDMAAAKASDPMGKQRMRYLLSLECVLVTLPPPIVTVCSSARAALGAARRSPPAHFAFFLKGLLGLGEPALRVLSRLCIRVSLREGLVPGDFLAKRRDLRRTLAKLLLDLCAKLQVA